MTVALRALLTVPLAVALTACGMHSQPRTFNLSGYSAVYKSGHADGCESAGGRMQRDSHRYKTDSDYMMGWNDGRDACK